MYLITRYLLDLRGGTSWIFLFCFRTLIDFVYWLRWPEYKISSILISGRNPSFVRSLVFILVWVYIFKMSTWSKKRWLYCLSPVHLFICPFSFCPSFPPKQIFSYHTSQEATWYLVCNLSFGLHTAFSDIGTEQYLISV